MFGRLYFLGKTMWTWETLLLLACVGASAGFLAGLFGIGGGTVIVPIMVWLLGYWGIGGEYVQHLAIGTSFAVMVFTTFSGALAQHRRGAIRWEIVRNMSPMMVLGGILGSMVARYIPAAHLQLVFTVFIYALSVQLLLGFSPKPRETMPGRAMMMGVGSGVGVLSSWVGIGGGTLSVPFLLYCRSTIHQATATSAGLAWPMSVSGAVGYLLAGWSVEGLPAGSIGFWYAPAAAILAMGTVLFAPIGVRVAHRLPAPVLKKAVGWLMFFIATQMLCKWAGWI